MVQEENRDYRVEAALGVARLLEARVADAHAVRVEARLAHRGR